mgnify:CR=1 FL=1
MLYTEGLVQDISAEKEASIALQQAKETAERASQLKTHFFYPSCLTNYARH